MIYYFLQSSLSDVLTFGVIFYTFSIIFPSSDREQLLKGEYLERLFIMPECNDCILLFILWVLSLVGWLATSCVMDSKYTKLLKEREKEEFNKNLKSIIEEILK